MCNMKSRLSPNITGDFVVFLFFFLTLSHSCKGQSKVIGPSQSIVSVVGDDIILPCYLDPATNAFDLTVEWSRPDLDRGYVLVWRDGAELRNKHPSYDGRTSLFTNELKMGNVSLKLSKVKLSDGGTYRCFIPGIAAIPVHLIVGAPTSPVIQYKNNTGELVLQCESTGWYPQPELLWLDGEGNLLPDEQTIKRPDDLYTVSSRVTVEKRHGNNFTCRVQQRNISQTRETQIHVPDDFFIIPATPRTPGNSNNTAVWAIVVTVLLLLILAVVFVVWKWKRSNFKNKRKSCEDRTEQGEKEQKLISDNSDVQVNMEKEGESTHLLAKQKEENNEDNKDNIRENVTRLVTESEPGTHQDQFVTRSELLMDMDRSEERTNTYVSTAKEPLISAEPETHPGQDMVGRQVQNNLDKREGEEIIRVEDNSALQMSLAAEGQQQNLPVSKEETDLREEKKETPSSDYHIDQQLQKPKNESDQDKVKNVSASTRQKQKLENQREQIPETDRQKNELQPGAETQENDKPLVKTQNRMDKHQVQQCKKEERSEKKPDTKREKHCEENHSDSYEMTERKSENQKEVNERLKPDEESDQDKIKNEFGSIGQNQEQNQNTQMQTEAEKQKVENEMKQKNDGTSITRTSSQHLEQQKHEGSKDQSNITAMRERKPENQNDRLKETSDVERIENEKAVQLETQVQKHNTVFRPRKILKARRAKCELMQIDKSQRCHVQHQQEQKLHVRPQHTFMKRKAQNEDGEQIYKKNRGVWGSTR